MRLLLSTLTILVAVTVTAAPRLERLRHLAVPTIADPDRPTTADPHPVTEAIGTAAVKVANLGGRRISGITQAPDGRLWIGLFDGGVAVLEPGATHASELAGLSGRERFVSAIAAHRDSIFAATYAGVLEFDASGGRVALHLEGIAADGLVSTAAGLVAATGRGAYQLTDGGTFSAIAGADDETGAPLRILSVGASGSTAWFGTPRGVFSVALGSSRPARWHPLVFGAPGAETNVATAVVAFPGGAVVGTDDGGLAWVSNDGEVRAARFAHARANEINPGAAVRYGRCALFGTQGAGLLTAVNEGAPAVARAGPRAQISAVAVVGDRVLVGTHEGALLALSFPAGACAEPHAVR